MIQLHCNLILLLASKVLESLQRKNSFHFIVKFKTIYSMLVHSHLHRHHNHLLHPHLQHHTPIFGFEAILPLHDFNHSLHRDYPTIIMKILIQPLCLSSFQVLAEGLEIIFLPFELSRRVDLAGTHLRKRSH